MILWIWAGAALLMLVLWLVQVRTRDASVVDVAWAYAVGAAGVAALALGDGDPLRRLLLGGLLAWWSLRLGSHLLIDRILRASSEDGRYAAWRQQSGPGWNRIAFGFFQAQAIFVAIFAIPAVAAADDPRPLGGALDLIGLGVWTVGQAVETIADRQLASWRRDPAHAGRTCRHGLWRLSRHPNYFGEWLQWCAWPLLAGGAWLWLHPLAVLAFLLVLTGIPHTERRALARRGDDYRRYQRSTSAFIPWFPRPESDP